MTLEQAIQAGHRLVIEIDQDMQRLAAEVFVVPGGVVFLDVGWPEPLAPPRAHTMAGTIQGDGPWRVGDWTIRALDDANPRERDEWARWQRNRRAAEAYGLATDRAAGAAYATRALELDIAVTP